MKKILKPASTLFVAVCFLMACNKEKTPLTITVSPDHPVVNSAVTLTSSQTGSGWKYSWEFGDGDFNSTNTSSTTHTYIQAGNYNVTLNVDHNGNPMGTCSVAITVQ